MPFDPSAIPANAREGDERLASLGRPNRVWAVGAIYGRCGQLSEMHRIIAKRLRPRDRLVYLGNYLGPHSLWTGEGPASIDELIAFRTGVISTYGFFAND